MLKLIALCAVLLLSFAGASYAQGDSLASCLADNTTGKDRKALARWIFVAMATHPELRELSATTDAATEHADKEMGVLVTRLLTESCRSEVQVVAKKGRGDQTMRQSFEFLGQLAMMELMSNKDVSAAVSRFGRYVDQQKLAEVLGAK